MELSDGIISSVTFKNEDTGYSVLKVSFKEEQLPVTCVGVMPLVSTGEIISVSGRWEVHKQFGKQFFVEKYSLKHPETREGIISFLSSGMLTSIGPVRAEKIVDHFGLGTLEIIENEPQRLSEIPGIGKKTVNKIISNWKDSADLKDLMLYLQPLGVSKSMALKIYRKYGQDAQTTISKNPYILCEEVHGIGFIKADGIARNMGFFPDSYKRIHAGILYLLSEAAGDGHTCLPETLLIERAAELLEVPRERVGFSIDHTVSIKKIIRFNGFLYDPILFYAEKATAENIRDRVLNTSVCSSEINDNWIDTYEKKCGFKLDPVQIEALARAAVSPMMLLTGGPGTGKTTIVRAIVSYFSQTGKRVVLAAPTGRAVQRLQEVTGVTAKTIHRLLEYKPNLEKKGSGFSRNSNNPLEADVLIVDEVSMIDMRLMHALCAAVTRETQFILVGDSDQLPSVGPGNVLADLIKWGEIPHIRLTTMFRQATDSRIISAAHEINNGNVPGFNNRHEDNCFFIKNDDQEEILSLIADLVTKRLPQKYGFDPIRSIQVLAPMHRGTLGTESINTFLQKKLIGSKANVVYGQYRYSVGDKVMQIKNNYDKHVFNGDIGIVEKIVDEIDLIVDYSGNTVAYEHEECDQIVPAYCISIHKSQGSEFDAVIIPLVTQHYMMLQRNLLYTAVTRAKKLCVIIGNMKALHIAVKNDDYSVRYSLLSEMLGELRSNVI